MTVTAKQQPRHRNGQFRETEKSEPAVASSRHARINVDVVDRLVQDNGGILTGMDLCDAQLDCWANDDGLILDAAQFDDAEMTRTEIIVDSARNASFQGADCQAATLSGTLDETSFYGADLSRSHLSETSFIRADLCRALLHGASLDQTCFDGSSMVHCDLTEARGIWTSFRRCTISADFHRAWLSDVSFDGATIFRSDFLDATMPRADFRGADLDDCDFAGADLTGADFTGARVRNCRFEFACLDGVIGLNC